MGKISSALKKRKSPAPALDDKSLHTHDSIHQDNEAQLEKKEASQLDDHSEARAKERIHPSPSKWDEKLSLAVEDKNIAESFRMLRGKILHSTTGDKIKTILIVSTEAQEGKSFVTANLAIALAQDVQQHALMVNCDLRRPSLARLFGFETQKGLTEYLRDGEDLADLILHTGLADLTLLPSGNPPSNPAELLTSVKMAQLVKELKGRYDDRLIVFDSPPVLAAAETCILAQHVDKVVLVVRWGAPGRENVKKCVEMLGRDKILGIVFNAFEMNFLDKKVQGIGYYNYYPQETY